VREDRPSKRWANEGRLRADQGFFSGSLTRLAASISDSSPHPFPTLQYGPEPSTWFSLEALSASLHRPSGGPGLMQHLGDPAVPSPVYMERTALAQKTGGGVARQYRTPARAKFDVEQFVRSDRGITHQIFSVSLKPLGLAVSCPHAKDGRTFDDSAPSARQFHTRSRDTRNLTRDLSGKPILSRAPSVS
jgi:hypothetical protein